MAFHANEEAVRRGEHLIPLGAEIVHCRSCQAAIVWTKTRAGRTIPLSIATVQVRAGQRYALSHFADCPDSKDWRR